MFAERSQRRAALRQCNRYIRQAAQKLRDEFDGDVPKTADELCSLPGVGPKMAFLALRIAWNLYVPTRRHVAYIA